MNSAAGSASDESTSTSTSNRPPWAMASSYGLFAGSAAHHQHHHGYYQHSEGHAADAQQRAAQEAQQAAAQAAWPIPDASVLEERWQHRNTILEETETHLRVNPPPLHGCFGGLAGTGRNILRVLQDRQLRGAHAVGTARAHWQRSRSRGGGNDSSNDESGSNRMMLLEEEEGEEDKPSDDADNHNRNNMPKSPSTVLLEDSGAACADAMDTTSPSTLTANANNNNNDNDSSDSNSHTGNDPPAMAATDADATNDGTAAAVSSDNNSNNNSKPAKNNNHPHPKASLPLRAIPYPMTIARELRTFGEYCSATKYHSAFLTHLGGDDELDAEGNRPASSRAVSTISIAFAKDGHTMASTHGDHTVKISCCSTGRLLQSLEGHPRTPWTVKYHPHNPHVVASGCLGHQVRVWNWCDKVCLQMVRLEFAIISLSFHPSGRVLAIANGTRLHFWGMDDNCSSSSSNNNGNNSNRSSANNATSSNTTRLQEMDQRHMLRCVHFPPGGDTLIIGGVNPVPDDPRRRRGGVGGGSGGMSFYLRLWDFDLATALGVTGGDHPGRRAIANVSCILWCFLLLFLFLCTGESVFEYKVDLTHAHTMMSFSFR